MDGFDTLVRDAAPLAPAAGGARRGRRVAHSAAPGQALLSHEPDDALSHRVPGDVRSLDVRPVVEERVSTHAWMGPDGLVIPLFRSTLDR